MSLSEADLSVVLEDLHPARAKWYNIGLQLGVSANDLDAIQSQFMNPEDALRELLKEWLKTVNPAPMWGAVVDALRNTTVGEFQLAEKLQHRHAVVVSLQGRYLYSYSYMYSSTLQKNTGWVASVALIHLPLT